MDKNSKTEKYKNDVKQLQNMKQKTFSYKKSIRQLTLKLKRTPEEIKESG
jgi:hypothetical protein